jgi:PAS domain S-box-containing protein
MPREVIQDLSPRENEILRLASEGYTDIAISHKLGIREGTIGTYWGRIRTKMGPYPRTELVAIRIRSQLQKQLDNMNEDRDVLEAKLQNSVRSELLYEDVVDQAAEGVVVVAASGKIEHANPAAHRMFKYEPGTLAGKALADLVPARIREQHSKHFFSFCRNPIGRPPTFRVRTLAVDSEGLEFHVGITVAVVHRGDEVLLTGLFEPIPEHGPEKFRMSVQELIEIGLTNAEQLDSDHDGWVDEDEFRTAAEALRKP